MSGWLVAGLLAAFLAASGSAYAFVTMHRRPVRRHVS